MTIDINQFWSLLAESKIASPSQIQRVFSEFSADSSVARQAPALAQWLTDKGLISSYQASILTAGHAGPFSYGQYRVSSRFEDGPLKGCFSAKHSGSGTKVVLHFAEGATADDLQRWGQIEAQAGRLAGIHSGLVVPVYETVVLNEHRFVVSEFPRGKSVMQLPGKSRLPWKQACFVGAQIAYGLSAIHDQGLKHGALSPASVWIDSSGRAQLYPGCGSLSVPWNYFKQLPEELLACVYDCLAPEVDQPEQQTADSEVYALGCLMVRLISGRPFCRDSDPEQKREFHRSGEKPQLEKYDLPAELSQLLDSMLSKDSSQRPQTAIEVARLLALNSGKAESIEAALEPSPEQASFRQSLDQILPGQAEEIELPLIAISEGPTARGDGQDSQEAGLEGADSETDASARIARARENAARRKQQKWKVPAAIGGALVVFMLLLGGGAWWLSQPPVAEQSGSDPEGGGGDGVVTPVNQEAGGAATSSAFLVQSLIEDDDASLWQSPTVGQPIDFGYLPPVPKLLLHVRGQDLLADAEGQRLLDAFGPEFANIVAQFTSQAGIGLADMEQLLVSFHEPLPSEDLPGQVGGYLPFAVVTMREPVALPQLVDLWGQPQPQTESGQTIFQNASGISYFPLSDLAPEPASEPTESQSVDQSANSSGAAQSRPIRRFAMGPTELIRASLGLPGGVPLSGSLRDLAETTDRQRHVTLVYLRPALFNDRGQAWMGSQLTDLNRQLSVLLPDQVQGGSISLHLDEGSYVELQFDRVVDLKAGDLLQRLDGDLRKQRDLLTDFIGTVAPNAYWNRVRMMYAGMLADVSRNFRWGIEQGEVMGNVWLPPMAAHNLVAASELLSAFSQGATVSTAPSREVPQSLDALLATPRDLNIANPPDLNVLMAELKVEIESDYGKLPFQWDIRLLGGDLEKDGITKNQRPGELIMEQKTLAEILTNIMVSANPAKDISGPADPECKLIWVVADDPEKPGQKAILITTRAAAAEKSYTLPAAFRE